MTVQEMLNILNSIEDKNTRIEINIDNEFIGIASASIERDEWDYNDILAVNLKAH